MLSRAVASAARSLIKPKSISAVSYSSSHHDHAVAKEHFNTCPNREVVGYGFNGEPSYMDHQMFPYPSVRFKAITKELEPIKQKEKGDWKNLTLEEKKTLYRATFAQTFAEMNAPTGEMKGAFGLSLIVVSVSLIAYILLYHAGVFPEKASSLSYEHRQEMLQKMIDLRWNPVSGTASRWDYEKNDWKK